MRKALLLFVAFFVIGMVPLMLSETFGSDEDKPAVEHVEPYVPITMSEDAIKNQGKYDPNPEGYSDGFVDPDPAPEPLDYAESSDYDEDYHAEFGYEEDEGSNVEFEGNF